MDHLYLTIINRAISLAIVVGALVYSGFEKGFDGNLIKPGLCSLFILCLIWFGDQIGSLTGFIGHSGNVNVESPGWMICAFGWILLIVVPVVLFFLNRG